MFYLVRKNVGLNHAGYTELNGLADPLIAISTLKKAARKPEEFLNMKVKDLDSFSEFIRPGVFNSAVDSIAHNDFNKDRGFTRLRMISS